MSPAPVATTPLGKLKLKLNSTFATAHRSGPKRPAGETARRAGAFLAFFALFVTIFHTGSPTAAAPGGKAGAALTGRRLVA